MAALRETSDVGAPVHLSGALLAMLASTCGLLVAFLYFGQPLSALISADLGLAPESAGLVVTLTQVGYCVGLVFLTPLGDKVENKRLVVTTMLCSIAALLAAAAAQSGPEFLLASLLIGLTSSVVQMIVPLAAHMAPPERRGRVVGSMTGGLLLGILLARPVASSLGGLAGWRVIFVASAVLTGLFVVVLSRRLPTLRPSGSASYAQLVGSLWQLFWTHRDLRKRGLSHAALFGTFSLFWTSTPWLLLSRGFTQHDIALFALAGASGALVAPIAGRLADRGFTKAVSIGSMLLAAAGFASTWYGGPLWLLVLAAIAVDAGVQGNHVVGQREVLALDPVSRSRMNSVYMSLFFVGGAIASALAGSLFSHAWVAVAIVGTALPLLSLVIYLLYETTAAKAGVPSK